eukprot:64796_1
MGGSAHDSWDITCFVPSPWSVFTWMVMNASNFFVCIFGLYLMYLTWKEKIDVQISIKSMVTIIIILFMGAEIQWMIHVTSSVLCDGQNIFGYQMWLDLGLIALFFDQIGLALLYLVFVVRLYRLFRGTPLQYLAMSQYSFISFIIGFLMQCSFASMVMFYFYVFPPQKWYYALNMIVAFGATNSFFSIILLSVFFRKVLKFNNKINSSSDDATLLKAAIRLIICASLGLLSTTVTSVFSFVRAVKDGEILWMTHVMVLSMDCSINLISLYLQFPFGIKTFYNVCGTIATKWQEFVHVSKTKNDCSNQSEKNIELATNSKTKTEIILDSEIEPKMVENKNEEEETKTPLMQMMEYNSAYKNKVNTTFVAENN